MDAVELKTAVTQYLTKKRYAVVYEAGVVRRGRRRVDVLAINMRGHVIVVETKSCRQDFVRDTKWQEYLDHCHKFYFAMDEGTYDAVQHLIPKGVGVFVVQPRPERKRKYPIRAVQSAKSMDLDPQAVFQLMVRVVFKKADATRYKRKS